MKKNVCQRCSQSSQDEETEEADPEHPSMKALLDATDDTIIQVAKHVYQGEWTLAPSMLSHWQHDDCMRELQQDLNRHMARAGLQGALSLTRTSRSRRCSWGHSASQTWSPSVEPWVMEATKWPREDSPTEQSGSQKWWSQLRGRSRSRQHQSLSPECQRYPSCHPLALQRSGHSSEWLCLYMRDMKLQAKTWKSRSRAQQGRAHALANESPKKQVQFNINEEFGSEHTLPTGMTLFLSGGEAFKWCNALAPTPMGPIDTLQPDHEEGPQWSSTPTGGSRPKVWSSANQPQSRPDRPDLVSHPHRWIHMEMLKIP